MDLDATDLRLLDLLQSDASLSNQALAERALTSPATALRRVRRLVDEGLIERSVAILNPQKLGAGLTALVEITLDALVQRLFTQDANVRNVKSFFSVHRAKFETRLPLPPAP